MDVYPFSVASQDWFTMEVAMPRTATHLVLTAEERAQLTELAESVHTPPALQQRARIVLACSVPHRIASVARDLDVSSVTVRKWRERFAAQGMAGLEDEQRSGRRSLCGDDVRERSLQSCRSSRRRARAAGTADCWRRPLACLPARSGQCCARRRSPLADRVRSL